MKMLWTLVESKKWYAKTKYLVALLILGMIFAAVGFLVWIPLRMWALSSWDWMACFMGWPIVAAVIIGIFYFFNHEFHDGRIIF